MRAIGNVVYAGVDHGRIFQRIEAKPTSFYWTRESRRRLHRPAHSVARDLGEGSGCADQVLNAS